MRSSEKLELPFTVHVERIIPGGKGLAFFQGRAVFVPQATPGDLLLVRGIRDRGSYLQVLSFEILEPSLKGFARPVLFLEIVVDAISNR